MLRQLLTILALFSGLAAAAEPAQATRLASTVASAALSTQGPACSAVRVRGDVNTVARRAGVAQETASVRPIFAVYIPRVMLRVDRAQE